MDEREEKRLHDAVSMTGLRAQATAVGLLQLTAELRRAGVLDEAAVARIKDAIAKDLTLATPNHTPKEEYEGGIRRRLDDLFSRGAEVGPTVVTS